ncbi:phosphotransferase family protein [Angustibacter sp. McL0619]|uniref:phosphotransferase family protein n=1 Tax=Angustibacter sp. McL0619 TaxID=3415676 RepID=UPI003CF29330
MPREYEPATPEILQWVAHHVHPRARVTAVAPLPGGITADMDRITVDSPAGLTDVVLRRWPDEDWAQGLVSREGSALEAVRGRGVPAPRLIAMDEEGVETGVRCTLTTALPGQPDLAPQDPASWLSQLASAQAAIHAVPDHPQTRWDGWFEEDAPLDWLADRGLRDVAREAASGPLVGEQVLVHGDYQQFKCCGAMGDSAASWTGRTRQLATEAPTSATAGSTWRCCSTPGRPRTIW